MILFAFYAALIWYACWRFRRRWIGVAAYAAGLFGLYFVWKVYTAMVRFTHGAWDTASMLVIFSAEAFIVTVVGGTLLAVRRNRVELPCRKCRYELAGLEAESPTCPECGLPDAGRRRRADRARTGTGRQPAASIR